MKVLIVGQGGREHAILNKVMESPLVQACFAAPGNPGMAEKATCVPIAVDDIAGLVAWAKGAEIDLTIVGPEGPLSLGIVDAFEAQGLLIFGPNKAAARLEGSKAFAKALMQKAGIPTARFEVVHSFEDASAALKQFVAPLVVKEDGLCAGKGVTICATQEEAQTLLQALYATHPTARVVLEEFLEGEEVSVLGITDGTRFIALSSAQDHKRLLDGDRGPNTGGMGAYSPAPLYTPELESKTLDQVIAPTLAALKAEGIEYKGVLYAGLMVVRGVPYVLEFNARFGDPETQVLLPRIENDLVPVLLAAAKGDLSGHALTWKPGACVTVVIAAQGYPTAPRKGDVIENLEAAQAQGVVITHAGTAMQEGRLISQGGRVLNVTRQAPSLEAALRAVYEAIPLIRLPGMQYRHDIAHRALERTRA